MVLSLNNRKQQNMFIYLENHKVIICRVLVLLLTLLQVACATWDEQKLRIPKKENPASTITNTTAPTKLPQKKKPVRAKVTQLPSISLHGSESVQTNEWENIKLPTEKLQINTDALPLNRFIHLALGDVLKQAFQVAPEIAQRIDPVTLHIATPIKAQRLLGLVQQALSAFDVAIIQIPDGLSVVPISQLSNSTPSLLSEKSRALIHLGRVMEIVPLKYAMPGEVMSFARHFLQIGTLADVTINSRLNAVIIVGDAQHVRQFKRAVALVDVPSAQGRYIRLIQPLYWKSSELIDTLKKTLGAQGIIVATSANTTSAGMRFIKIKHLNGIVITSPDKKWLDMSLALIDKLDVPTTFGDTVKPYIYFVKNTRAEELGKIVNHVFNRTSINIKHKQNFKLNRNSTSVASKSAFNNQATSTGKKGANNKKTQINNNQAVITDTRRNALIFVGTGQEYSELIPIIESLDILPRQVLIEVMVAEVTLNNTMQLGVEWEVNNINAGKFISKIGTQGGLGLVSGGLTYQLINQASGVAAMISAMATEGRAKILSSPKVLAMDNETARIQVGDQLLVVSGEVANNSGTSGNSTGVVRTFNYVDTGIILEVTPVINEGGVIQLKLHQEVSNAGASLNNTPPIFKRLVDTTLVANSGQSILIGGLISHKTTASDSKVPYLADIPYLGALFKVRSTTEIITELVIIITPYLFDDAQDSKLRMDEFKHIVW